MLYDEKVIPMVFKLAAKLAGTADTEKLYNEYGSFVINLLSDYVTKEKNEEGVNFLYSWNEKVAKKFNDELTDIQRIILTFIKNNKNEASLDQLIKELQLKGYKGANGYTLAGTFAGLTRKCLKYDIPYIYDYKKTSESAGHYYIPDPVLVHINKYL